MSSENNNFITHEQASSALFQITMINLINPCLLLYFKKVRQRIYSENSISRSFARPNSLKWKPALRVYQLIKGEFVGMIATNYNVIIC